MIGVYYRHRQRSTATRTRFLSWDAVRVITVTRVGWHAVRVITVTRVGWHAVRFITVTKVTRVTMVIKVVRIIRVVSVSVGSAIVCICASACLLACVCKKERQTER